MMDRDEAAAELDRLEDLGRGSMSFVELLRTLWQRRSAWSAVGAALVMAAPQAVVVTMGGPWSQSEVTMLIGSTFPAGYVILTGALAPGLSPWRRRLWLSSKIVGATMVSFAISVLAIAGAFGFIIAAVALAVAAGCALGTVLLRQGLIVGAIPPIIALVLLGRALMPYHFELAEDAMAAHAAEFGAFATAGFIALLALVALISSPPRRS